MADNKKLVEAITSMEVDFAQWYTDVVKKAELIDYTSVKKPVWRMYIFLCLFRKAYYRRKKIT